MGSSCRARSDPAPLESAAAEAVLWAVIAFGRGPRRRTRWFSQEDEITNGRVPCSGHALVQPSHQSWWCSNSPKMAEATGSSEFTPGKLVLTASISFSFFVLIDIIDLFPSISQPNPTQATNPVLQSRRLKNKTNNEFNNPSIQGKQKERRGSSCREERLYKYMQLSSDTRHAS